MIMWLNQVLPIAYMVVGATARDLHHHALGHQFSTAATQDLDLALALHSWDAFEALSRAFEPAGNTGMRFKIADVTVDLRRRGLSMRS